jgi:diadenosine tetraphosphate (Ap4A) HIT family hydrolase
VVPHVHFHIIPRPESIPSIESRSWTMFGRGRRYDLDDEEGDKLAKQIREALKQEIVRASREKSSI